MPVTRTPVLCGSAISLEGPDGDAYIKTLPDGEPYVDDVLPVIADLLDTDSVVLDIGANIGVYTLAAARLAPTGAVHAFEPNPNVAHHLRRNVEANHAPNVTVHEIAVSAKDGTVRFKENPTFTAGSVTLDEAGTAYSAAFGGGAIEVPAVTLDSVTADLDRVDVVKIDTEGHELDVLAGAHDTLERFRPVVFLEFSTFSLTAHRGMLPADALAELRKIFDRVHVITTGGFREIHTDRDAIEFLHENATVEPVQELLCTFAGSDIDLVRAEDQVTVTERQWLRDRLAAHEQALVAERRTVEELGSALARAEAERDALRRSASWRMTRPLRAIRRRWWH